MKISHTLSSFARAYDQDLIGTLTKQGKAIWLHRTSGTSLKCPIQGIEMFNEDEAPSLTGRMVNIH